MSSPVNWDPDAYLGFTDQRARPAMELAARIPLTSPGHVVDLGCGTGAAAIRLAERWPGAAVVGVDSSPEMLAVARSLSSAVTWVEGDIASWSPSEPVDVIHSNAALHWVADHDELFPRLMAALAPGGVLAVQMPLSWDQPSHRLVREALHDLDVASAEVRAVYDRRPVAGPEWYHGILRPLAAEVQVWTTTHLEELQGVDPVLDWMAGAALRPLLEALGGGDRDRFLADYGARVAAAYPPTDEGTTIFPFTRLFIVALAPSAG